MDETGASYIEIPNWDRFQHYKERRPIWVKTYVDLMSDDDYLGLSGHRRAILHGIWLEYASSARRLRGDAFSLTRRLSLRVTTKDVESLVQAGFIQLSASKTLASCEQDASDVLAQSKRQRQRKSTVSGSKEPSTAEPASSDGVQVLVSRFVDESRKRGSEPPRSVVGQIARQTKTLIGEGFGADAIVTAYSALLDKGQHPATLPSFVHAASMNGHAPKSALTGFEKATQWVRNGGYQCPDSSLMEELGRFGLEGDQKKRLRDLALELQAHA